MRQVDLDRWHMAHALRLAEKGRGWVEPNPLVGCLIARGAEIIGEGWHRRFGGPHAEIEALRLAGSRARDATLYVTLEPCCHQGKTPPCTRPIIAAGIARVVVAQQDPFPAVDGRGADELRRAGIQVEIGLLEDEARRLNAPYLKLLATGRPWVIAKWAMSLDGKIATRAGASRWISSPRSRAIVHELRGRVDAIVVGRGTAVADDPLLTARPAGKRVATRVVLDRQASLPLDSQLVRTAREIPLIVAAGKPAPADNRQRLAAAGCEVIECAGESPVEHVGALLAELGRRRMTNVLIEGGSRVLGTLLEAGEIDEVHAFIAPMLLGGESAPSPMAGLGLATPGEAPALEHCVVRQIDGDVYIKGRIARPGKP
jgi:diaminohydroxyphosphoribosylaminopyrimidine deaminase/5-amino-6-(5-phosphoribosylamino)uracil reductase